MGLTTFGVVSAAGVTSTWDPASTIPMATGEPGTIQVYKNSSGEMSLVRVIQMGNTSCTAGQVLIQNHATLKGYSRRVAGTADSGGIPSGISVAAIGSHKCGYEYCGGYAIADQSQDCASGEYLMLSGSTAGQLTNDRASTFHSNTAWGVTSGFHVVGVLRGVGTAACAASIQMLGLWG